MDFKEYIVQRIKEMPLVTLATEKKDGAVCIDFTKVCEKMYNGVLIGNAANAAKILTEEYMTTVTPDAEKDQLLWFTYDMYRQEHADKYGEAEESPSTIEQIKRKASVWQII